MPLGACGSRRLLAAFDSLAETYLGGVDWEPREAIDRRAAHLLPGLFLARIDGKSPVEYLTEEQDKDTVRRVARSLLADPPPRLADNSPRLGERNPCRHDKGMPWPNHG